jgi:formate dehydrogenase major subunit
MKRPTDTIRVRIPRSGRVWELAPLAPSPCTLACPTRINARGYVSLVADGRFADALELIRERNPFPGVCGRVCPRPCEAACTRGRYDEPVAICALKRYVFDLEMKRGLNPAALVPKSRAEKIAVVGAGPAGLSAAAELAKLGYPVTIFEARNIPGGMMNLIPGFRLPSEVVRREANMILGMGIELVTGATFGKDITWNRLRHRGYKALLLATGAWKPSWRWGRAGAGGVLHAIELLDAVALPAGPAHGKLLERVAGKSVVVAGDGTMALDCARAALRLGARRVTYLVGAGRELAPLHRDEVVLAEKEGLVFSFLSRPKRLAARGGRLSEVVCARLDEGAKDATGRRGIVERPDGEFAVAADLFVDAHSRGIDIRAYAGDLGLETTPAGTVAVDRATAAAAPGGVFAAGDLVAGPRSVVEAIASGQRAALGVHHHLSGETVASPLDLSIDDSIVHGEYTLEIAPEERSPRAAMPVEGARNRRSDFREVEKGFPDRAARREAQRCLRCGPCSECPICVDICEKKDFLLTIGDDFAVSAHAGREFWSALPETVTIEAGGEETEARTVRTIVRVDEDRCVGCGRCAEACGYTAIQIEARPRGGFIARVDDLACKGCGNCVAVCPTGALDQISFDDAKISRMIASVSPRTKVLFICHWARPARLELPNDVIVIETMCAGRVATSLVVEAALRGSPRILVCGCGEDACHYGFGRSRAHLAVERTRELLRIFGLNPNIVTELSTSPGEFALAVDRWAWKSK